MSADTKGTPIMEVQNLVKHFPITRGVIFQRQVGAVKAVDDVSFDIYPGETLGIVGETGCGKSTTARLLVRLLDPTSGTVRFEGEDIALRKGPALKALHRKMQMIFQDPFSSLNPRKTVGSIIADPYVIHGLYKGEGQRKKRVQELMDRVGLNPEHYNRYPHEFSGGQRQRIGVARAIALEPKLLIADEPVSALDVSIQAQVLNLLRGLQREMGLTLVFIAHDLSVVRHMCDRVAVMYLGKIVEIGPGRRSTPSRATPTPARCCRPCRCPTRSAAAASDSCSRATCRARPTHRARAGSTRAARRPRSSARPRSRSSRTRARARGRPATSRSPRRRSGCASPPRSLAFFGALSRSASSASSASSARLRRRRRTATLEPAPGRARPTA